MNKNNDIPDVHALMESIRRRVKEDASRLKDPKIPFPTATANFAGPSRKPGELAHSEELRYLNRNHAFSLDSKLGEIKTHRPGIVGKFLVKVKRKIKSYFWESLFKEYFRDEKEYLTNLVRYLNDVSRYVDARDTAQFVELVRKIDTDVTRANERIERARDEGTATIRGAEERLFEQLTAVDRKVQMLDGVARGLEGIVNSLKGGALTAPIKNASEQPGTAIPDLSYLLLENRYRGSEEVISSRLKVYPAIFSGAKSPVLEMGPGRGELQALFKAAGVPSYGVDLDEAMVKVASERGFDVRLGDGIAHLRSLPDGSLGGLIAVQVVEHLTQSQLRELFELAKRKVVMGGPIVCETIDPRSVVALSSNYFRDPTHVWPQHPDTLSYAMTLCGLKVREIKSLSPFPTSSRLQILEPHATMDAELAGALQVINHNFAKLDAILFGHQDYCIIAEA